MTDKKECVVCGEEFDTSWQLTKHKWNHTKEQKFVNDLAEKVLEDEE